MRYIILIHSKHRWVDMTPRFWRATPMPVAIHQPRARWERKRRMSRRISGQKVARRGVWNNLQMGMETLIRVMQKGWAGLREKR